jgi:hypothetical protein
MDEATAARSRPRWPGLLSFALGMLTVAGLVTGLVLVTADRFPEATMTAWIAAGVGGAAVLAGLVALIGRFGRSWAAAGLVLGVVGNPPVLTRALDAIGGVWA